MYLYNYIYVYICKHIYSVGLRDVQNVFNTFPTFTFKKHWKHRKRKHNEAGHVQKTTHAKC